MEDNDAMKIFKALADKTRQDILELLAEDEMNVSDICSEFNSSQPTISHHLHILRNCNLIESRKEGKKIFYYVKKEIIRDVFGTIIKRMRITLIQEEDDRIS